MLIAFRVLSRIFCSWGGGESSLKKIFEPRDGEKKFILEGSGGMLPQKILKI